MWPLGRSNVTEVLKKFFQNKKTLLLFSIIILFASVLQVFLNIISLIDQQPLVDFQIYIQVAREFLTGANPYQFPYVQSIGGIPFNYPPGALLFFLPFSFVDIKTAEIIFTILSFLAFLVSFLLLRKILPYKIPTPYFILILAFLIQTFPFKFTLTLGQVNNFVLLFIIIAFVFYQKNKKLLAAIFLALASALKLYPLGLLFIFILKKDLKSAFSTFLIFIIMNIFNPSLFMGYSINVVPMLSSLRPDETFYNQSILVFFLRLTDNFPFSRVLSFAIIIILLVKLTLIHQRFPLVATYFTLLAIISISGPFAWQHHLIFVYPFIQLFFKKPLQLFLIWLLFAFHFKDPLNPLLKNPLIASYQTIAILILISWVLFVRRKDMIAKRPR